VSGHKLALHMADTIMDRRNNADLSIDFSLQGRRPSGVGAYRNSRATAKGE
jgi:hypothetical protein